MTATASPSSRRRGLSSVEFVIVSLVFGMGVVTLYSMFWGSAEAEIETRLTYLAAQAAREELEAIRTRNLFGHHDQPRYTGHDYQPLTGSMVQGLSPATVTGNAAFDYPEEYARIQTRAEVKGDPASKVLTIVVTVRYQAQGNKEMGLETPDGTPKPIAVFKTLVTDRLGQ